MVVALLAERRVSFTVTEELDAAGLPEELGAFDMLLHRGEANPRTRSGIMAVEILLDFRS